jgi:hypothetical protein
MHARAYARTVDPPEEGVPWRPPRRSRGAPRRRPSSARPWSPKPASSRPSSCTAASRTKARASAWPRCTGSSMRSVTAVRPIRSPSPRLSSSAPARRPSITIISSASAAAPPSRSTRRARTGCARLAACERIRDHPPRLRDLRHLRRLPSRRRLRSAWAFSGLRDSRGPRVRPGHTRISLVTLQQLGAWTKLLQFHRAGVARPAVGR